MSRWRVGVDSGGTFTDVCLFDEQDGPGRGLEGAVDARRSVARHRRGRRGRHAPRGARRDGRPAASIGYFGHGTTVATNALIQHRGVRTGLITTDGFRDLLEIGRQKRPDLYDIQADKPPTLVPRDLRLEVPERLRHTGEVDDAARRGRGARRRAGACARRACKAVAVCFLYGFVRPEHEKRARRDPARGAARRLHLAPATRSRPSSASSSGCRRWC